MKRILITGSDGFLGQNLIKKLGKNEIVKVDKNPKMLTTLDFDVATWEFSKYFKSTEKFDVVYHFGSPCSIIQYNNNASYCAKNTLEGFFRVLNLAEQWNAKFIYPSSGNVYGTAVLPHTENKIPQPTNLYGKYKYQTEIIAEKSTTDIVGLRIYAGYGSIEEQKGNLASVICLFLKKMMNGRNPIVFGDGSQTRDFIYIDDIIDGLTKCMSLNGSHIINLGSGQSHSFNQVIEIINEVLKTNIVPEYVGKPKNYVKATLSDTSFMKRILGLNPISLEEGITKFIEYLKVYMDT